MGIECPHGYRYFAIINLDTSSLMLTNLKIVIMDKFFKLGIFSLALMLSICTWAQDTATIHFTGQGESGWTDDLNIFQGHDYIGTITQINTISQEVPAGKHIFAGIKSGDKKAASIIIEVEPGQQYYIVADFSKKNFMINGTEDDVLSSEASAKIADNNVIEFDEMEKEFIEDVFAKSVTKTIGTPEKYAALLAPEVEEIEEVEEEITPVAETAVASNETGRTEKINETPAAPETSLEDIEAAQKSANEAMALIEFQKASKKYTQTMEELQKNPTADDYMDKLSAATDEFLLASNKYKAIKGDPDNNTGTATFEATGNDTHVVANTDNDLKQSSQVVIEAEETEVAVQAPQPQPETEPAPPVEPKIATAKEFDALLIERVGVFSPPMGGSIEDMLVSTRAYNKKIKEELANLQDEARLDNDAIRAEGKVTFAQTMFSLEEFQEASLEYTNVMNEISARPLAFGNNKKMKAASEKYQAATQKYNESLKIPNPSAMVTTGSLAGSAQGSSYSTKSDTEVAGDIASNVGTNARESYYLDLLAKAKKTGSSPSSDVLSIATNSVLNNEGEIVKIKKSSENEANGLKYRRSSLYTMMINDEAREHFGVIRDAFGNSQLSEKFNDHNIGPYLINAPGGQDEEDQSSVITDYLNRNGVARALVAKWFNRNANGEFNMDLVAARGSYNASDLDVKVAMNTERGKAILADAGEELIGNTFVIVYDFRYTNKQETARKAGGWLSAISTVASVAGLDVVSTAADAANLGTQVMGKGYGVKTVSYLYRLEWDEEVAANFYNNYWMDASNHSEDKKTAFESSDLFKLKLVGTETVRANLQSTIFSSKDNSDLIRIATIKAQDKGISQLQRSFEEFRTKSPLLSGEPITAKIGVKEGLEKGDKFEVLEQVLDKDGRTEYQRVGVIKVEKNGIWDNSYMSEEIAENQSQDEFTTFKGNEGKYASGMLIRQIN